MIKSDRTVQKGRTACITAQGRSKSAMLAVKSIRPPIALSRRGTAELYPKLAKHSQIANFEGVPFFPSPPTYYPDLTDS